MRAERAPKEKSSIKKGRSVRAYGPHSAVLDAGADRSAPQPQASPASSFTVRGSAAYYARRAKRASHHSLRSWRSLVPRAGSRSHEASAARAWADCGESTCEIQFAERVQM